MSDELDLIAVLGMLFVLWMIMVFVVELIKYNQRKENVIGRALNCMNTICPEHGFSSGTLYEDENGSGCYCYNETHSDFYEIWNDN